MSTSPPPDWLPWLYAPSTRCGFCQHAVWLTVDDSGLCVRCDALVYPNAY